MKSQNGAIAHQNHAGISDTETVGVGVKIRKRFYLAFKQECVRQIMISGNATKFVT